MAGIKPSQISKCQTLGELGDRSKELTIIVSWRKKNEVQSIERRLRIRAIKMDKSSICLITPLERVRRRVMEMEY